MVKAANGFKMLYPEVVRLTCLAHALHTAAKEVQGSYSDIAKLILNIKKVFVKGPLRVQQFKQEVPLLLLPYPVLTRWGTSDDATFYYCKTYTAIEVIFKGFDSSELSSIRVVKEQFSNILSGSLAYRKEPHIYIYLPGGCWCIAAQLF
jgi:hypothetical protein